MATFSPELRRSMLKIGTLEVWQPPPRRIALQPELGGKLRVAMSLSFPRRSAGQGLRWLTQEHPLWNLEKDWDSLCKPVSFVKPRKLKVGHP